MNDRRKDGKSGSPEMTRRGLLGLLGGGAASMAGNVPAVGALTNLTSSAGTIANYFGVPDMLRMGNLISQVTDIFSNPAGAEFLHMMDSRRVLLGTLDHAGIDRAFTKYITSIQPFMEKQHAYETFMRGAVQKAMGTDHFISELLPEERAGLDDLVSELSQNHPAFKPEQTQRLGAFLFRMVKAQGGKALDSGFFTLFEGQAPHTFMQNSLRSALDVVLEDQALPVPSPKEMFRNIVLDNAEQMRGIGHPVSHELFQKLKLDKEFGDYDSFQQEVEKASEQIDEEIAQQETSTQAMPLYELIQTLAAQGHKPISFSHNVIESDGTIINTDAGVELSTEPFDSVTIHFPQGSDEAISKTLACLYEHYPADDNLIEELSAFGALPFHVQGNTLRIITDDEHLIDEMSAIQEDFDIPLHQGWASREHDREPAITSLG